MLTRFFLVIMVFSTSFFANTDLVFSTSSLPEIDLVFDCKLDGHRVTVNSSITRIYNDKHPIIKDFIGHYYIGSSFINDVYMPDTGYSLGYDFTAIVTISKTSGQHMLYKDFPVLVSSMMDVSANTFKNKVNVGPIKFFTQHFKSKVRVVLFPLSSIERAEYIEIRNRRTNKIIFNTIIAEYENFEDVFKGDTPPRCVPDFV